MTIYLKFEDEAAGRIALAEWLIDGAWPNYIDSAAVDVLGMVQRPTGEVLQGPQGEVPVYVVIPGFHINLSSPVPELTPFEIDAPATPTRVFAGSGEIVAPRVPAEVTRWQAKMVLMKTAGETGSLWDDLIALRASMKDGEESVMLDAAIHELLYWRRTSPTVEWVAMLLGLSDKRVDALFVAAGALAP